MSAGRTVAALGLWVGVAGPAQAACGPGVVPERIASADAAIGALDIEALAGAIEAVHAALACPEARLDPRLAASVHRVTGIHHFVSGDPVGAAAAFEAARWLDPSAALGHDIGGPLQAAWDRAEVRSAPALRPVRVPEVGEAVVDGRVVGEAPSFVPFVLQLHAEGVVQQGWWVGPGAPLPDYPGRALGEERRARLALAAGVSLGLSGLALGGAGALRLRHNHPETSWEDAQRLVLPNRVLGGVGVGLAAAGIGLGGAAIVQGRF